MNVKSYVLVFPLVVMLSNCGGGEDTDTVTPTTSSQSSVGQSSVMSSTNESTSSSSSSVYSSLAVASSHSSIDDIVVSSSVSSEVIIIEQCVSGSPIWPGCSDEYQQCDETQGGYWNGYYCEYYSSSSETAVSSVVSSAFQSVSSAVSSSTASSVPATTVNVGSLIWEDTPHTVNSSGISWFEAQTYCADLTLEGIDNWRVPTIQELLSIVDSSHYPKIMETFTYAQAGPYWSNDGHDPYLATPQAGNETEAYVVDFHSGIESGYYDKSYNSLIYVRCVSDGAVQPNPEVQQCKIVGETGLLTYQEAENYCAGINAIVPTIYDMYKLYEIYDGTLPVETLGLWTSTPVQGTDDQHWMVYFMENGVEQTAFFDTDLRDRICIDKPCATPCFNCIFVDAQEPLNAPVSLQDGAKLYEGKYWEDTPHTALLPGDDEDAKTLPFRLTGAQNDPNEIDDAQEYCAALNIAAMRWRLPDLDELETLYQAGSGIKDQFDTPANIVRTEPPFNYVYAGQYLSGTTFLYGGVAGVEPEVKAVDFRASGLAVGANFVFFDDPNYVRCINADEPVTPLDINGIDFSQGEDAHLQSKGGALHIYCRGKEAVYRSTLYFIEPVTGNDKLICDSDESNQAPKVFGPYDVNTTLKFKLRVATTGKQFVSGEGAQNEDGVVHAKAISNGDELYVGFEDRFDPAPGEDFDDCRFKVLGAKLAR